MLQYIRAAILGPFPTSVYLAKLSKEPFHIFVLECLSINYSVKGRLRVYVPPSILKETSLFV